MYVLGNTVGSSRRVNQTVLAYIAGFLDGDGCIKAKIDKQSNNRFGMRTRIFVSFTQHTRNKHVLEWIYSHLQNGSIADYPNKRMSEYVISDSKFIYRLLKSLKPYVVNKTRQLDLGMQLLQLKDRFKNERSFNKALSLAIQIRGLNNYPKKTTFSSPVTTCPI
jgi:hypothetical protein